MSDLEVETRALFQKMTIAKKTSLISASELPDCSSREDLGIIGGSPEPEIAQRHQERFLGCCGER